MAHLYCTADCPVYTSNKFALVIYNSNEGCLSKVDFNLSCFYLPCTSLNIKCLQPNIHSTPFVHVQYTILSSTWIINVTLGFTDHIHVLYASWSAFELNFRRNKSSIWLFAMHEDLRRWTLILQNTIQPRWHLTYSIWEMIHSTM